MKSRFISIARDGGAVMIDKRVGEGLLKESVL